MTPTGNPRHRRHGQQANFLTWLAESFGGFFAGASGRRRGSEKKRRHRHGTSAAHEHSEEYSPAHSQVHSGAHIHEAPGRDWRAREVDELNEVKKAGFLRRVLVAGVLLGLMWIGWSIVAQTAAQNLAISDPDAALSWVAHEPDALDQLAQQELPDPDGNLDAAQDWAQRALRSNPLDARALSLLGLIAERKSDRQSADALMRISGARTWRDRITQSWLFDRDVRRGDYEHALPHVDAILRTDPEFNTELLPVFAWFTANSRAFKALTDFLATSPPWRSWLLRELSGRLVDRSRLVQLYSALKETENPPTIDELRPYLTRLIKDGDFEQAYQMWRDTLPPALRANETYPYNRDFDAPMDELPFNWVLNTIPGADIQIVSSPDGGRKRALRVQFSGARVDFANVKQLLLLPPGNYTLGGRVKTQELQTSRGLWWHIFCADDVTKTLAQTELVSGTVAWTDFKVDFQVPTKACKAQWLQLELPARIATEHKIEGQVWYQYLQIAPTQGTGGAPRAN